MKNDGNGRGTAGAAFFVNEGSFHVQVEHFRRQLLKAALIMHGGCRSRTARALGLQRTSLVRLIRVYGLGVEVPRVRPGYVRVVEAGRL